MSQTILIVDDQENDRVILERLLRQQGVVNPVVSLSDGADAICYLKGEGRYCDRKNFPFPSVIFLDILFPNRSGIEVLQCLKALKPSLKPLTIIYTKLTDLKTIQETYNLGGDSFLGKPPKSDDIVNLIRHFRKPWQFGDLPQA
ncbi:MAG TPA: response regulator [Verrucomicrobiae bacterium]|nr:response regulator [Verrucomicrobiae bacterium]